MIIAAQEGGEGGQETPRTAEPSQALSAYLQLETAFGVLRERADPAPALIGDVRSLGEGVQMVDQYVPSLHVPRVVIVCAAAETGSYVSDPAGVQRTEIRSVAAVVHQGFSDGLDRSGGVREQGDPKIPAPQLVGREWKDEVLQISPKGHGAAADLNRPDGLWLRSLAVQGVATVDAEQGLASGIELGSGQLGIAVREGYVGPAPEHFSHAADAIRKPDVIGVAGEDQLAIGVSDGLLEVGTDAERRAILEDAQGKAEAPGGLERDLHGLVGGIVVAKDDLVRRVGLSQDARELGADIRSGVVAAHGDRDEGPGADGRHERPRSGPEAARVHTQVILGRWALLGVDIGCRHS